MANDIANYMVRDGDYDVVYIAAEHGIYKYFPHADLLLPFKPVDYAAGERGLMIGYGALGGIPPVVVPPTVARVLIGTRNAPAGKGGIWDGSSGTWVLHTVHADVNNFVWERIAIDPTNLAHWVILGRTPDGKVVTTGATSISGGWTGGTIVDQATGKSPCWETTDAGATWNEVTLPSPRLYIDQLAKTDMRVQESFMEFSANGTLGIASNYYGIGNFFGVAFPGNTFWCGPTNAMQVVGAQTDNAYRMGKPSGPGAEIMIHGMAAGSGGDFVLSGWWGGGTMGGVAIRAAGEVLINAPGTPAQDIRNAPSKADVIRAIQIQHNADGSRGSIVGFGTGNNKTQYGAASYATPMSAATVNDTAPPGERVISTYRSGGVFASLGTAGVGYAGSYANPLTSVYAERPGSVVGAVGGTYVKVAARKYYNANTDGNLQAVFYVWDGTTWATFDGPTDAAAMNTSLSLTAIAIIEPPEEP